MASYARNRSVRPCRLGQGEVVNGCGGGSGTRGPMASFFDACWNTRLLSCQIGAVRTSDELFMSLIPPYFLDAVAALGVRRMEQGDTIRYSATAFVFGYPVSPPTKPASYWVFVVTNRHVVDHDQQMWVRFHAPSGARPKVLPIPRGPRPLPWLVHPDPDIDLAVLPLDAMQIPPDLVPNRFLTLKSHTATVEDLRASEFSEGNEVFILGFPLSANIPETPATLGISVGRWR